MGCVHPFCSVVIVIVDERYCWRSEKSGVSGKFLKLSFDYQLNPNRISFNVMYHWLLDSHFCLLSIYLKSLGLQDKMTFVQLSFKFVIKKWLETLLLRAYFGFYKTCSVTPTIIKGILLVLLNNSLGKIQIVNLNDFYTITNTCFELHVLRIWIEFVGLDFFGQVKTNFSYVLRNSVSKYLSK